MFLKNKQISFIFLFFLTDCLVFIFSAIFAYYIRFIFLNTQSIYSFNIFFILTLFAIPIWILFVNFFIKYKFIYISLFNLFIKILKTSTFFIIFILILIFIFKNDCSRLLILFIYLNLIIFTFASRYILKQIVSIIIYQLKLRTNLLVIGKQVRRFKSIFNSHYINKVYYYPYILDTNNIEKLKILSIKKNIKEIVIIEYLIKDSEFLSLCDWAQTNNIDIKILPNELQMTKDKLILDDTLGVPVILLTHNHVTDFNYLIKRFFDIILSLSSLIILSPIFLVISIIIKLESKGPVIYKQVRVGYNKQLFNCYKFRSMYSDADIKLKELKSNNTNIFFKIKEDPRVTKFGKFIRKYSIDEIPQFINVLKGEMSLVGPRPMLESEVNIIEKTYHNYNYQKLFKVLPGISGLWQVSGRSLLNDDKKIELEIFYVDNWSLLLDIKILLKTIIVVLFHKGAY